VSKPLHNVVLIGRAGLDPDADVIGAHQLTIEAGITYRQLDFWTRCGYLTPVTDALPGSGRPRVYSIDQVDLARQMARVLAAGVREASVAHDVAVELLAHGQARLGDFTITHHHEESA
jgi:hypothetical protein